MGGYLGQANEAINNNELLTEQERYAKLEQVYQQYLESKRALGEQYALQEQELAKSQHQEQLNLWGVWFLRLRIHGAKLHKQLKIVLRAIFSL